MLEAVGIIAAIVVAVIAILGGTYATIKRTARVLTYPKSRERVANWLAANTLQRRYAALLGAGIDRMDAFIRWAGRLGEGKNPYKFGNFFRGWYLIAVAYPLALLLLGYAFGGPFAVGASALDSNIELWRRLVVFIALVTCSAAGPMAIIFAQIYKKKVARNIVPSFGVEVAVAIAVVITSFIAVVVVDTFSGVAEVNVVAAIAVSTTAVAVAIVGSMRAFVIVGITAVAIFGAIFRDSIDYYLSILLFSVFLPCLNVFFDWVSWGVSRWCLEGLRRNVTSPSGSSRKAIAKDLGLLILDAVVAIVLLKVLVLFFPIGLALLNAGGGAITDTFVPLDWKLYLGIAREHPLTSGLAATGMVITTLLPTVAHLLLGGIAILRWDWIEEFLGRTRLVSDLREHDSVLADDPLKAGGEAVHVLAVYLVPPAVCFSGLWLALWVLFTQTGDPIAWYGTFLADTAQWSGDWADTWLGNVYAPR